LLKGHKPSSIRYLLLSVPYTKQLNFTFDGLKQAAHSVGRLRDFKARLQMVKLAPGNNERIQALATETRQKMRAGLEDDLNTALALGAMFDMVREANTVADRGELREDDRAPLLAVLEQFDEIFAVLKDDDAPKIARAAEWAKAHGIVESALASDMMHDD